MVKICIFCRQLGGGGGEQSVTWFSRACVPTSMLWLWMYAWHTRCGITASWDFTKRPSSRHCPNKNWRNSVSKAFSKYMYCKLAWHFMHILLWLPMLDDQIMSSTISSLMLICYFKGVPQFLLAINHLSSWIVPQFKIWLSRLVPGRFPPSEGCSCTIVMSKDIWQ